MKDDLLHGNGFEPPRRVGAAASRPAPVALSPLVWQARPVRKRMPSLPEACGERSGVERAAGATDMVRLLVVGDSTAAGVGVACMRDALPPQLAAIVAESRGCTVAWTVSARTGATASFTAEELVPAAPEHVRPGGQIVLAGLPNLGRFRTFPQPLRAVLGWHSRTLDRELRQVARRRPVVTRVALPPVSWPEMFADDRFHPNAAAYRALAAALRRSAHHIG